jgi:hypothetical protein
MISIIFIIINTYLIAIMCLTQFKCFASLYSFSLPYKIKKMRHEVKSVINREKLKYRSTENDE